MTDHFITPPPCAAFAEMTEGEFNQWLHQPTTRAFFAYLRDQADNWRAGFLDLWEDGLFSPAPKPEHEHPELIRGQVLAFRQLAEIRLPDIQQFYAEASEADDSQG